MLPFSISREASPMSGHRSAMACHDDVFSKLAPLEATYPAFRSWFFSTVVPAHSDERAVFVAKNHNCILGIGIAKRSQTERKLCTLWTAPAARNKGVALAIAQQAFEWLETSHPLFTVPEERLSEFRQLLNRWQFKQVTAIVGYYRPTKTEYVFNGQLHAKLAS
jgi:hypothetical protein